LVEEIGFQRGTGQAEAGNQRVEIGRAGLVEAGFLFEGGGGVIGVVAGSL
jgi:hypothetical protein